MGIIARKITSVITTIQALVDKPNLGSSTALKAKFDESPENLRLALNGTIDDLGSIVDGSSGAKQIGSPTIAGITGNDVEAQIKSLQTNITAKADAASVYTQTQLNNGQLDSLYINKTNTTAFAPTGLYHPSTKKYVDDGIAAVTLGQIPDNSLTNTKLGTDIKVGSLATLTTNAKTDVVSAINENVTNIGLKVPSSYLDTDGTLTANSDTKIPTQKAIKTYVDGKTTVMATASNTLLTTTSATTIITYTPTVQKNFLLGIYYRVITGTTNVTITVTYTDDTGVQTNTMLNAQSSAVGSYSLVPLFINAKPTGAITITATASVANQVYVSANIQGV